LATAAEEELLLSLANRRVQHLLWLVARLNRGGGAVDTGQADSSSRGSGSRLFLRIQNALLEPVSFPGLGRAAWRLLFIESGTRTAARHLGRADTRSDSARLLREKAILGGRQLRRRE
jgi:hypothetical protein